MSFNKYFGQSESELNNEQLAALATIPVSAIPYMANMNQNVSTSSSPQFSRVLLDDGGALLPSLSFKTDTNTGLYHGANPDEVALATSGTIRLLVEAGDIKTVNSTLTLQDDLRIGTGIPWSLKSDFLTGDTTIKGNLGVGIDPATEKLDVVGNIKCARIIPSIDDNIMAGQLTGQDLTTGINNILFGLYTGRRITTGSDNISIGTYATTFNETGNKNITIGYDTGTNLLLDNNICIGNNAEIDATTSSGIAIGDEVKARGDVSISIGKQAITNVGCDYSISIGSETGTGCTTGTVEANGRILIGSLVGNTVTDISSSVIIGNQSCYGGIGTGGDKHTILGNQCATHMRSSFGLSLVGYKAGQNITIGSYNNCFGYLAGDTITTGVSNICIGADSDVMDADDISVVAIGSTAKATDYGISIGSETGVACTTPTTIDTARTLIGNEIGKTNTDLSSSAIVGSQSLYNGFGTGGNSHAILGQQCAINNQSASGLSLVGYRAGYDITTGDFNSCFGFGSGLGLTIGFYNTLLGYQAGDNITTGSNNVCIGRDSQTQDVADQNTVIIGRSAVGTDYSISIGTETGTGCTAVTTLDTARILIGNAIGKTNTDLTNSAIVGSRTCYNGTGSGGNSHAILGHRCALNNEEATGLSLVGFASGYSLTTGDYNSCLGYYSGFFLSTGEYNTLIGYKAGDNITIGDFNICIGADAQTQEVDDSNVITIGQGAIATDYSISLGSDTGKACTAITGINSARTLIGNNVGKTNTDLQNSVIIGSYSCYNGTGTGGVGHAILGNSCAINNQSATGLSLVGYGSGYSITTGEYNSCLGYFSGYGLTTGAYNTLLGYKAGDNITTGINNVCIGKDAQTNATNVNNAISIGTSAQAGTGGINIGDSTVATTNTVRIGHISISDNIFYGKISVPALEISGGSSLNHYSEYEANVSFINAFDPALTSVGIKLTRIGKVVTLRLLEVSAPGNATANLATGSAVIPANFRPTTSTYFFIQIEDQGITKLGSAFISSTGNIQIGNQFVTNYTAGTADNGWKDFSVTYRQT